MPALPLLGFDVGPAIRKGISAPPGVRAGADGFNALTDGAGGVPPPPGGWFPDVWPAPKVPPAAAVPLGVFALAFLAGAATNLALRWLWNYLNQRPQQPSYRPPLPTYSFATPGSVTFNWLLTTHYGPTYYCDDPPSRAGGPYNAQTGGSGGGNGLTGIQILQGQVSRNYGCSGGSMPAYDFGWRNIRANGDTYGSAYLGAGSTTNPPGFQNNDAWVKFEVTDLKYNGQPLPLAPVVPDPYFLPPFIEPEAEPLPEAPEVPPLPKAPPIAPPMEQPIETPPQPTEVPPNEQPSPAPPLPLTPQWPPGFLQWLLAQGLVIAAPGPQPNPGTGQLPPPAPAPVPVTPTQVENFLGQLIGQPGTAPPPTLAGIAGEVGKIEQKLRILGAKPDPPPTDLTDILQLLGELWQLLSSAYGAGQYELVPPCGETSGGAPAPPDVAQWTGGIGPTSLIGKKLDAIAELLQAHKNQRQPICIARSQGRGVRVNFIEGGP